ncbi:pfs domain-containing protein [Colletotrichum higginsianum]|nr:pfs domain-containing protein [Colletotrichum higginsianum]
MATGTALDDPESYTVGWIAALPIERAAAIAMLDEKHAEPKGFTRHPTDTNVYTWGRMGEHNIAIASLAAGVYGLTSAATTASSLSSSLPSIRIGLLVGIGGGIPRPDEGRDIRLGDVAVSEPDGTTGGVCQYDLVKARPGNRRERKGFLGKPPTVLLKALTSIRADHEMKDSKIPELVEGMLKNNPKMAKKSKQSPGYVHQGFDSDRLFDASYEHVSGPDCHSCGEANEVEREPRDTTNPEIHYGVIASGNTLVKDAAAREQIVADVGEDCICFEMEAAGLMNHFPCLVIRGISDYADSHKNDRWQRYASATAAAYAKEFLAYVPAAEVQGSKRALEILESVEQKVTVTQQTTLAMKEAVESVVSGNQREKIRHWLAPPPDPSTNANQARKLRHEGTGGWLLETAEFQNWVAGTYRHLWLHGLAGCGKTVLSSTILDHLMGEDGRVVLSFFFDFNDQTKQTLDGMLRSLASQLYQGGLDSAARLDNAFRAHRDGENKPTTNFLRDAVRMILADQKQVFVVIDALDESTTRDEICSWIKSMFSTPELVHVRLLYTGRPEAEFISEIPTLIGEESCLRLNKLAIDADIRSYVTARLENDPGFNKKRLSEDLIEQLRDRVGNRADGM